MSKYPGVEIFVPVGLGSFGKIFAYSLVPEWGGGHLGIFCVLVPLLLLFVSSLVIDECRVPSNGPEIERFLLTSIHGYFGGIPAVCSLS